MKKIITNVLNWVFMSSENPENVSLTIQAGFVAALPTIMIAFHLLNIPVPQNTVQAIVSLIEANLVVALQMVAGGITLYAGARKIWNTIYDLIQSLKVPKV